MIDKSTITMHPLSEYLTEYKELNSNSQFRPVAVGRYGIRTRESIYSKELAKDYSKNKLIHKGTLTVGMGSVQMDIGILSEDITYSVSPAYHTYRISGVDYDYLRYCLQCRNMDMFTRFMKRGSRQGKSIDLNRWISYEIPIYPQNVQLEIVDRLKRAQSIIDLKQEELAALDEVVKARFVEMFGDTKYAFEKWGGKPFREITINLDSKRKPVKDADRKKMQGEYPYYGATGIVDYVNDYRQDGVFLLISEDGKALEFRNKPIAFIAKGKIWVNNHAHVQQCKEECNMIYLMHLINMMDISQWVTGIDQKKLNRENLDSIPIALPPITKQQQFELFYEQIDKSKVAAQQALDEAQLLFDSLLQAYFG